jgi:hypothetical protein
MAVSSVRIPAKRGVKFLLKKIFIKNEIFFVLFVKSIFN